MNRHLLKLAQKASYDYVRYIEIEGVSFKFELYRYGNQSGFVHFASMYKDGVNVSDAKAQYYNRTWERYTGQSVFKECVSWALKSNDITQNEYDALKKALEESEGKW